MDKRYLEGNSITNVVEKYPFLIEFLNENDIVINGKEHLTFIEFYNTFSEEQLEDKAINVELVLQNISEYIKQMIDLLGLEESNEVKSLTILPGRNKLGDTETFGELLIKKGDIVSIVGPTGSGKSRLLADIEWTAQGDTPTLRKIMVNEEIPDKKWRYSSSNKLVAQLSQNMNFVMDLSVYEFLELHAKSRMVENEEDIINKIIAEANNLAGESFKPETPITSLSGGQSRALMIADTAILSSSPIILIDEIENAGIDRKRALELLVKEDKIVLIATHDPVLALMGAKRIIISNGGISQVIETTEEEREVLGELERMDKFIQGMRTKLRYGKKLNLGGEDA
jgi:ABC-type lipoprotein export system ATPase subunit